MKQLVKYFLRYTYQPLLAKYLATTRIYTYGDIRLRIPPGVFHPGFFFSTRLLLRYVQRLPLAGRTFLELGAGSGLISIYAAKHHAIVTASDINPASIRCVQENSRYNGTAIKVVQSDLFKTLPLQPYDIIVINPPYYWKNPVSHADYAWYCGENGEYFSRLFDGLVHYLHAHSIVLLVMSDGCDLAATRDMAEVSGFMLDCVEQSRNLLETNYIFKLNLQNALAATSEHTAHRR